MKSSFRGDMSSLQIFVKGLDDKHNVQVGIFGNKNQRKTGHDTTNAQLGAVHEYGSFSRHIPARSFLRMPITMKAKEILKETMVGAEELLAKGQKVRLLKRLGIACENAIQAAFTSRGFGTWKANKPATIRHKGSDAPLIDTAQLRRAIASRVATI